MEIISSGINSQFHNFPNLDTKHTYSHIANEAEDFQFFPDKNLFLSINKKSGFELLRTYNKNGQDIIQRMKKRQMNDLCCGAVSRFSKGEVALGFTTGYIKFFSIETGEFSAVKFRPAKIGNSVIYLDYSNCDDVLACIYDDGAINLYGLNTSVKMDTIKLDQTSTLLRFHPTKRFHLGVVSWNGNVTVLDSQSKRTIFQQKLAHKAPCPDLCWSPALPDTLVTVGYDCNLNVFDLRQKTIITKILHQHPYSTVCLSGCGNYCCAGNLKGDIIAYDFRNLKVPLTTKRTHDGNVIRVAFVPNSTDNNTFGTIENASSSIESQAPDLKATDQFERRNSFNEFFDMCCMNVADAKRYSIRPRNSFFDFDLQPTRFQDVSSDYSRDSASETSIENTIDIIPKSSELRLNRNSIHKRKQSVNKSVIDEIEDDVFLNVPSISAYLDSSMAKKDKDRTHRRRALAPNDVLQLRKRNDLNKIEENDNLDKNVLHENITRNNDIIVNNDDNKNCNNTKIIDKENQFKQIGQFNQISNDNFSSTPNQLKPKFDKCVNPNMAPNKQCEMCHKKIENLEKLMTDRLQQIQLVIQENKNQIMNQIVHVNFGLQSSMWNMEETAITDIREGVGALVQNDSVIMDYSALHAENIKLKRQLYEFVNSNQF